MAHRSLLALAILITMANGRAVAADLTVRFEAGATDYSRRSFSGSSLGNSELTLNGGYVLSVAGEYRHNPRVGVELSASQIALDAEWRAFEIRGVGNPPRPVAIPAGSDAGDFTAQPVAVALLFHPLRASRSDFYVGPQVAWVRFDIGLEGPPDRESEAGLGAKVGWEWHPARSPWSVGLVYRFLEVQHEGVERDPYTGLPLHLLSLVLSHRFRGSHSSP